MILKSGTIIPFMFKNEKKLITITSLNDNENIQFNDIETAIYLAFDNLKNKCKFFNPKIEFHIPEELLISYLEQRQDLTNFVVKIFETNEIRNINKECLGVAAQQKNDDDDPWPDPKAQQSIEGFKIKYILSCNENENKRDGSHGPIMQIKRLKLDTIDPHLEEILKLLPKGKEITKNYESNNQLNAQDRLALIKLLISFEFKNLVKTKAPIAIDTKRLTHLSDAIVCKFPSENPSMYFVEYSKSFKYIAGGILYEFFHKKKLQYIKQMEGQRRYLDSSGEEMYEDDFPETVDLLKITDDWPLFFKAWKYTFDLRMAYFYNGLNPMDYFDKIVSNLYDRMNDLVEYDFERLYPKKGNNLFHNWDQLNEKIFTAAHVNGLKDIPLILDTYGHLSELCGLMILSYFVENFERREVKTFEKNDISNLVIHLEDVTGDPDEFIKEYYSDYISTESLIVFASGVRSPEEEHKFYVLVGSKVYLMESALKAIDFCFKCYQILHLYYPDEQSLSWQVIQDIFYDLKSTRNYNRNPTLLENLLKFLRELE